MDVKEWQELLGALATHADANNVQILFAKTEKVGDISEVTSVIFSPVGEQTTKDDEGA